MVHPTGILCLRRIKKSAFTEFAACAVLSRPFQQTVIYCESLRPTPRSERQRKRTQLASPYAKGGPPKNAATHSPMSGATDHQVRAISRSVISTQSSHHTPVHQAANHPA